MHKVFPTLMTGIYVFLMGCSSVPMAPKVQDIMLKSFAAPSNDKSGIYIYRNTDFGRALKKKIYIDGVLVGVSINKVYFYKEIEPGIHKISTESEFSDNHIELKSERGTNYFVEQFTKMGTFIAGADLDVVSAEEGKKGVLSCNLAQ